MESATKNNDTVDILIRALEKIDDEIKSAIETIEIMANPETLKGIEEGLQDIKEGRTYTFDEFVKKHGYDVAILEQRSDESSRPLTEYLAEKAK